LKISIP